MNEVIQDVRYALRQLRKSPGFTAVAVITLALGVGANTAIFSAVEGVMLSPLHYFEPGRLVAVWESNPRFPRVWASYPNFADWLRNTHSFAEMAAFRQQGVDLTSPGAPAHLTASQVTSGFFHLLGVQLRLGREFSKSEDQHGGTPVAIISNQLWKDRFAGSSKVVGSVLTLDGTDYSVVGVAPTGFHLEGAADLYIPLGQGEPLILNNRASHDGIFVLARLAPGVTLNQAQAEMSAIQNRLDRLYPNDNRDLGIYVEPLKQMIVGEASRILLLISGAVGLVLLIACANISNLLLARSTVRSREFAIRSALGASRARVLRQLLTESLLLSLAGACAGVGVAICGTKFFLAAMPGMLPRSDDIALNGTVLLYTLGIAVTIGVLFGLAPALKSSTADPQSTLKQGGHGSTASNRHAQNFFIVLQVSLTLLLLAGAGLLLRTMLHLRDANPGFDPTNVITFKVGVSHTLTRTAASTRVVYQELVNRIRQVPGVQDADFTDAVPLTGETGTMPFWLDSQRPVSLQGAPRLQAFITGTNYLRVLKIPVLQGRVFNQEDTTKSPCVAVIDSAFRDEYFAGRDPLGHTITAGFASFGPCVIVGVAGHVKNWALDETNTKNESQAYYSLYQDPDKWVPVNYPDTKMIVRTPLEVAAVMRAIKAVVQQQSSDEPVYEVRTMEEIVSDSMSTQRFPMILLGTLAVLSLALASVGISGVISYSVTQRVQEIGVRMALGANKENILSLMVTEELKVCFVGIALGVIVALLLGGIVPGLTDVLAGSVREIQTRWP
ncbi:MAG TPA: ABC transporter permease [Terriglobales bacterium]|nr:ABC transporter permease [Terriglobales bacterium]